MKYFLSILLLLFLCNASAQQFHECNVYRYHENDSLNQTFVCRQTLNSKGKIIHQVADHDMFDVGIDGQLDRHSSCEYFMFYNCDTLLALKLNTRKINAWSIDSKGAYIMDSDSTYYSYNAQDKLVKELDVMHGHIDTNDKITNCNDCDLNAIIIPDTIDQIIYLYYKSGLMVEKNNYNMYRTYSKSVYKYDVHGRIMCDSTYVPENKNYSLVKYLYNKDGYEKYTNSSESLYDNHDRLLSLEIYNYPSSYIAEKTNSPKPKIATKISNNYYEDGRIYKSISTLYYKADSITTTDVYIYK